MATLWTKDSDLTSQNGQKHAIAQYACQYLLQHAKHSVIGMGTGSTINYLIDALAPYKQFFTCIASSQATEQRLASHGIAIANTNTNDSEVTTFRRQIVHLFVASSSSASSSSALF